MHPWHTRAPLVVSSNKKKRGNYQEGRREKIREKDGQGRGERHQKGARQMGTEWAPPARRVHLEHPGRTLPALAHFGSGYAKV